MVAQTVSECGSARRGRRPSGSVSGREALLGAAMACFGRHGYDGCSLRLVAAEAGVDMALVARLFGAKAALWNAVIDRLAEDQAGHLESLAALADLAAIDPAEAMRRFITLAAEMSFRVPQFHAFLMQEVNHPGERLAIITERLLDPFERMALPVVATVQAAGAIRTSDPKLFLDMLFAAIALPIACPAPDQPTFSAERRDRIVAEAIRLFVVDNPEPQPDQAKRARARTASEQEGMLQ